MSVRKLALAALCRVNSLRQSLAENRAPIVRGIAITAGLFLATGDNMAQAGGGHQLPPHDPLMLDADYQWFEPITAADLADLKPKKRANTGWYGGVDRLNLWVTRPEDSSATGFQSGDWLLDSGTGFRFDLGYMLDNDHGYSMTFMDFNVASYEGFNLERLNRFNLEALTGEGEVVGPPFAEVVPVEDDNNFGFNNRFIEVRDSNNVVDFNSFELNKTWRLEPYHYGGMLEPLIGARYIRFDSTWQDMDVIQGPFLAPNSSVLSIAGVGERVTTDYELTSNNLIAGQVGFRYFKFVDRFRVSGELRLFGGGSFYSSKSQRLENTTYYETTADTTTVVVPGSGGAENTVITIDDLSEDVVTYQESRATTPVYRNGSNYAWGTDIRGELSYTLSRMIELRGGVQVIDIAQGVSRRSFGSFDPNQRALMAGLTFGVTLNR